MTVLIIGSEGFIGTELYNIFSQKYNCICSDVIQSTKKNYNLLNKFNPNYDFLFSKEGSSNTYIDVCINASGSANVGFSLENPLLDSELNFFNVEKILEAIRLYTPTTRFINLSSAAVYGNPESLPVKEDNALSPMSPYGYHKMYSEQACKMYKSIYGITTYSLRLFSVYGIGQKKLLLWDLINKFQKNPQVELFGIGQESRDYMNISDIVSVIELFSLGFDKFGNKIESGSYNVANGKQVYVREIAEMIRLALKSEKEITFSGKVKPGDPLNWEADITKLKKLGFKSSVSIEKGIEEYSAWALTQI